MAEDKTTDFLLALEQVMSGEQRDYLEFPVSAGHPGQILNQDMEASLVAGSKVEYPVDLKVWEYKQPQPRVIKVLDVIRGDLNNWKAFEVKSVDPPAESGDRTEFVLLEGPMVLTMPGEFKRMRLLSFGVHVEEVET